MKAGFIGLGTLGRTMAQRLISEGLELALWNRTIEKTQGLAGKIAESPTELASETDIIFLNLFDSEAVEAVLEGPGGILGSDCKGKIIIDTTTNHFDSAVRFHEACREAGISYLEAPVLGSVAPASQGKLTVLVGGEKDAYKKALPYIQKIGEKIYFMEEPGLATKMKLVNNLTLGTFMAAIAEALILGEAIGIEREKVLDILDNGGGKSLVLSAKKEKLTKEDFSPHFSTECIYKDLHCLQDLAKDLNKPLFTGATAKELFGRVRAQGLGGEDFSAIYRALKEN